MATKIVIGANKDGKLTAILVDLEKKSDPGVYPCVSEQAGFSYCTKDWAKVELIRYAGTKECMFMLGILHGMGIKDAEIDSFIGFFA